MKDQLSRRDFLKVTTLLVGSTALAASCRPLNSEGEIDIRQGIKYPNLVDIIARDSNIPVTFGKVNPHRVFSFAIEALHPNTNNPYPDEEVKKGLMDYLDIKENYSHALILRKENGERLGTDIGAIPGSPLNLELTKKALNPDLYRSELAPFELDVAHVLMLGFLNYGSVKLEEKTQFEELENQVLDKYIKPESIVEAKQIINTGIENIGQIPENIDIKTCRYLWLALAWQAMHPEEQDKLNDFAAKVNAQSALFVPRLEKLFPDPVMRKAFEKSWNEYDSAAFTEIPKKPEVYLVQAQNGYAKKINEFTGGEIDKKDWYLYAYYGKNNKYNRKFKVPEDILTGMPDSSFGKLDDFANIPGNERENVIKNLTNEFGFNIVEPGLLQAFQLNPEAIKAYVVPNKLVGTTGKEGEKNSPTRLIYGIPKNNHDQMKPIDHNNIILMLGEFVKDRVNPQQGLMTVSLTPSWITEVTDTVNRALEKGVDHLSTDYLNTPLEKMYRLLEKGTFDQLGLISRESFNPKSQCLQNILGLWLSNSVYGGSDKRIRNATVLRGIKDVGVLQVDYQLPTNVYKTWADFVEEFTIGLTKLDKSNVVNSNIAYEADGVTPVIFHQGEAIPSEGLITIEDKQFVVLYGQSDSYFKGSGRMYAIPLDEAVKSCVSIDPDNNIWEGVKTAANIFFILSAARYLKFALEGPETAGQFVTETLKFLSKSPDRNFGRLISTFPTAERNAVEQGLIMLKKILH